MIVEPTVFVLGAGASRPYGFPTGSELADAVCEMLPQRDPRDKRIRNESPASQEIRKWTRTEAADGNWREIAPETAADFRTSFLQSGCLTLDEFVEAPGNHRFLSLVKAAIVYQLVSRENDPALYRKTDPGADWLGYLFQHMKAPNPEHFGQNKVRFITFNFDRSVERKLFLMIRGAYGLGDDAAAELCSNIEILHMHGMLGGCSWLSEHTNSEARAYDPWINEKCASLTSNIRIVHEEVHDSHVIETAHAWLQEASTICFLGFGFHPTNAQRLQLDHPYWR